MKNNPDKVKNGFFASCPGGLEELLLAEVKALAPQEATQVKGGVEFTCLPEIAIELMFTSRIASRVYKKLYTFDVKTEKDLYYFAKEIKWKAIFNLEQTFKINVVLSRSKDGKKKSKFENTMFLGQKLKDAVVDRFRKDCNDERPSVEKVHPDVTLLLHLEPHVNEFASKETATILIDMCGRPLSQRGYKVAEFSAPLRENLAAGLVLLSGFNKKEAFIDAMCGSGTLLVEALLIKADIPPTFLNLQWLKSETKFWDLENHLWFYKSDYLVEQFKALIEKYEEKHQKGLEELQSSKTLVKGSDIDTEALRACAMNIAKADLTDFVELDRTDALKLENDLESGVLIVNPPYGERMGEDEDLVHLYHELGETFKNQFKGFRAYVFTGNMELLKKISLRTSKKHILYNGNIEARLAEYLLY